MKKRLIVTVTFIGGLYYFFKFFLPVGYGGDILDSWLPQVSRFNIVMGAVAVFLGVVNIFRVYGAKVVKKDKTWLEAAVLLACFLITFIVGLITIIWPEEEGYAKKFFNGYSLVGVFMPLGSAMFSLLGFYITRAAFRAFRVRNVEAALVMGSALLIMLGALPIPVWEAVLPSALGAIRQWLLAGINAGVQRAILVGSGIAWLIMAVRMWFSLDEAGRSTTGGTG